MALALVLFAVCVLFALATYGILYQLGVIPGSPGSGQRPPSTSSTSSTSATSAFGLRARTPLEQARSGGRELPQGCLVTVLAGAALWFLLWGVVLVLALRFLSDPFGG